MTEEIRETVTVEPGEAKPEESKKEYEARRKREWRAKQKLKPTISPKETEDNQNIALVETIEPKETREPKKTKEHRVTIGLTIDGQLNEVLRKKAEKNRLSLSRYVEITLRKALRL